MEYERQAVEVHRWILPRQAFVGQELSELGLRLARHGRDAFLGGARAPLQALEFDHVAVAHAGEAPARDARGRQ